MRVSPLRGAPGWLWALALLLAGCGQGEPEYGRHTLAEWRAIAVAPYAEPALRHDALEALGFLAREAPDQVARALAELPGDSDAESRRLAVTVYAACGEFGRAGLERSLADSVPSVVEAALAALGGWGPRAWPSARAMVERLASKHSTVALQASFAVGRLGPQVTPLLAPYVAAPQPSVRALALGALAAADPTSPQALALLVNALDDPEWTVRVRASGLLAARAASSPEARDALGARLEDAHPSVVAAATRSLAEAGAAALPFLTRLVALLVSEQGPVRAAAALALGRLGPPSRAAALPRVEAALLTERGAAAVALWIARWRLSGEAPPSVAGLRALLSGEEERALDAVKALGEMGAEAAPAVDDLVSALSKRNLRMAAARALGAIGPAAAAAQRTLEGLRQDPNLAFREQVRLTLERIRGAAAPR